MRKVTFTIQNAHRNSVTGQTGTSGEVDLLDKVYFSLAPKLIEKGIEVYYEDDGLWDSEGNFVGLLNGDKDYFLALHLDGSVNPSANGGMIDAGDVGSPTVDKDWKFIQTIADYYFGPMGIRFKGEAGRTDNTKYYYAFYATGTNTVQGLIELGTLTNQSDREKCQDYGKIATLLAQGIIAYLTQYDKNYQDYLASQQTESCETTLAKLRIELAQQKEKLGKLQQETSKQLADKETECQLKISRLKQDIVSFINNYK